jgi:hypothetical protein
MWALASPPEDEPPGLLAAAPRQLLGALALAGGLLVAATAAGGVAFAALPGAGIALVQAGLLATAVAWATAGAPPATAATVAAIPTGGIAAGGLLTALAPLGALAYLATPVALAVMAARGHLRRLGLGGPVAARDLLLGVVVGAVLGGHLLLAASWTPGWGVRRTPPGASLARLAYDLGANVPAGECFFRGALFNRLQRRGSAGVAALVSTTAWVGRYVVDPLLPRDVEALLGAVFYLGLLGAANCWLLRRSGSLLPAMAASLIFFVAYRAVGRV